MIGKYRWVSGRDGRDPDPDLRRVPGARKYLNWRIPLGIFATVFVFSEILYLINGEAFPPPFFMIFSGGLMLGAMYMATDMVTSPVTNLGSLDLRCRYRGSGGPHPGLGWTS